MKLTKQQKSIVKKYNKYATPHNFWKKRLNGHHLAVGGFGLGGGLNIAAFIMTGSAFAAIAAPLACVWGGYEYVQSRKIQKKLNNYQWENDGQWGNGRQQLQSHYSIASALYVINSNLLDIAGAKWEIQRGATLDGRFFGVKGKGPEALDQLNKIEKELRAEEEALIPAIEVLDNKPYKRYSPPSM